MAISLQAQNLTQTVKGRITDQDAKIPAIGAIVVVVDSDPVIATSTDMDGNFKLENIPVGRISLRITSLGYEDRLIPNIQVTSGKEVIVNAEVVESVNKLEEIVVKAKDDKKEALNEMSLVSSRLISVEETKRYAGTINDPSRMVSSFAGVNGDPEGNNDIIVRGNSPKGILWRMEGVEIPNPNHFAEEGSTGGAISALNSVMLANSDFSTGAFAPEYGNALSGVMDMKLRTGNNEEREYTFGLGVLGTDITLEGPFKKGGKSSYIANYRYSSLGLLDDAGIVDFGGVPKYQDATFKINAPTKKLGTFTMFGLGGISHILDQSTSKNGDTIYNQADFGTNMGIIGVGNIFFLDDKTYIDSKLSFATNGSGTDYSEADSLNDLKDIYNDNLTKNSIRASTSFNRKINAKNRIESGLIYTHQGYNFFSEYFDDEQNKYVRQLDEKGNTGYTQAYTSWKHRLNKDITIVGGVHYIHLMLNNSYSIEPRLSAKWKLNPRHAINGGIGVHSKVSSMLDYFARVSQPDGTQSTPNTKLKLPKARHFVLGYDYGINENTHAKVEAYYQQLYDVPVENVDTSTYSTINSSQWFNNVELVNEGTGENYGIELTLERFFADNYYYMFTGSVFNSTYKALDGVERNTVFNGNYTSNFLIGREFTLGKKKNKVLNLNTRITYVGGRRYTPLDLQSSILNNQSIFFNDQTYASKGDDVLVINIGGNYQINREKTTHIIKLEVLNATNNQAKLYEYYDSDKEDIGYGTQLNMIPNIMYQVQF